MGFLVKDASKQKHHHHLHWPFLYLDFRYLFWYAKYKLQPHKVQLSLLASHQTTMATVVLWNQGPNFSAFRSLCKCSLNWNHAFKSCNTQFSRILQPLLSFFHFLSLSWHIFETQFLNGLHLQVFNKQPSTRTTANLSSLIFHSVNQFFWNLFIYWKTNIIPLNSPFRPLAKFYAFH